MCREAVLWYFLISLKQIVLEKVFLLKSETLGLLVNTLTTDFEYSHSNREKLLLQIQMQLCKKLKAFC